jgi:isoquinoline 1-oxidoreductase subunit alpha
MSLQLQQFTLTVNGVRRHVTDLPDTPLLWVLREELGLTGTKYGCGRGLCGACTVHAGTTAVRSCRTPLSSAVGRDIRTIEGLGQTSVGRALQRAWINVDVPQCGYCQPGQLMSAAALLGAHTVPTDPEIDRAMAGNLCRCGTYARIREAIHAAAEALRHEGRPSNAAVMP